uniref:GST N-terminal domain-containing protein n=2 Tax=Chaetoceros debilis TaxID=122233 RepID=A0A7S3V3X1_9STRA|mmetsp:Transcript_12442/g.18699  ORF Transcript_12442/g.18699 Transcript_12442/m.18699 type:complete len:460 (+) Transcript_12442:95-1474(+)
MISFTVSLVFFFRAAYFVTAFLLPKTGRVNFNFNERNISSHPPSAALRMSIPNSFDTLTSGLASIARLPFGTIVSGDAKSTPPPILALYDKEGSNECRVVRERITELDLVVDVVVPSATNSRVFNDENYEYFLGKDSSAATVPRLIVQKEDIEETLVGADKIITYFEEIYGERPPVVDENDEEIKKQVVSALILFAENLPSLFRYNRGNTVAGCALPPSKPMPSMLVLYSYEGNQFCRLVREVLTELDVPYTLKSAGKGSTRRTELSDITGGSTQCPYLMDPNTGKNISDSKDIIQYLYKNYALFTPPNELLGDLSDILTPILKPVYKQLAPLQAGSGGENKVEYEATIAAAKSQIEEEIASEDIVIYTYSLSPFCTEATAVLDNLEVAYKEISLGKEWVPFLINEDGPQKRAALGEMTGQTALPHVFVSGKNVGGLYDGLLPALEDGSFWKLLKGDNK